MPKLDKTEDPVWDDSNIKKAVEKDKAEKLTILKTK
jgi:hypothetical protein